MENKDYYGIGSTENGNYKTLDNGLTWFQISSNGDCEINGANGRIILCSQTDKGLSYSDDGGETINPSNIRNGNWANLIYSKDKKEVYATRDDGSIAKSLNEGETWEIIFNSSQNGNIKFNSSWLDENGNVNFGGNFAGFTVSPNGSGLANIGLVNTSNGAFSTVTFEDGVVSLIPVLNKIVAPKIYYEATGRIFQNDIGEIDTLLKEAQLLYVSPEQCLSEVIDWENDVGMRPFTITLSDLLDDTENVALTTKVYDNDTPTMKKTISTIRKYIDRRKELIIREAASELQPLNVNTDNIINSDETEESKLNALEVQKVYTDVQKYGALAILGTAFNRIFLSTDVFIRKLIYAAIYEEIVAVAGSIKIQLDKINSQGGEKTVTENDFKINYSLPRGVKTAFDKYLKSISNVITSVDDSNDKQYIMQASKYYNNSKADFIEQAYKVIASVAPEKLIEKTVKKGETFDCSNYVKNLYKNLIFQFNNNLNIVYSFPSDLNNNLNDIKKVIFYLKIIYKKFEERLADYSDYIFENIFTDFVSASNDLVNSKAQKYFEENEGTFTPDYETIRKGFLLLFRNSWYSSEELI